MNRAQRRREERAATKRRTTVLIAGEGIVATSLGYQFEAIPHAELPVKQPGVHRWIAAAAFVINLEMVEAVDDPDTMKFLDQENLFELAIGCFDCEQTLLQIEPRSVCSGEPSS